MRMRIGFKEHWLLPLDSGPRLVSCVRKPASEHVHERRCGKVGIQELVEVDNSLRLHKPAHSGQSDSCIMKPKVPVTVILTFHS